MAGCGTRWLAIVLVSVFTVFLSKTAPLSAQTFVWRTISDPKGRAIPLCTITAGAQSQNPAISRSDGFYRLNAVMSAGQDVTIHIQRSGYKAVLKDVHLPIQNSLNITLTPDTPPNLVDVSTAITRALNHVDDFYRPMNALQPGLRTFTGSGTFNITAQQQGGDIVFSSSGRAAQGGPFLTSITYADLAKLPPDSQQLILALEESMTSHYKTWTTLYAQRSDPQLSVQKLSEIDSGLSANGAEMCSDLNHILDFLNTLNYSLEDHYHSVRFVCRDFAQRTGQSISE